MSRPAAPASRRKHCGDRREAHRQDGLVEDLVAVHRGERHLGRRDGPQVVALDVVGVVGELGQVAGRGHGLGEDQGGRPDLLVGVGVAVEGERGERPQQPGPGPAVEGEHRAGQPGAAGHVEQAERLAHLPVGHPLVVGGDRGSGWPSLGARPPSPHHHVVLGPGPVGRVLRRQVGQVEEGRAHLLAQVVGRGGRRSLVGPSRRLSPASSSARAAVPGLAGLAHLPGDRLHLGPQRLLAGPGRRGATASSSAPAGRPRPARRPAEPGRA